MRTQQEQDVVRQSTQVSDCGVISCTTLVRFSCANVQSIHLCGGAESVHVHTYMSESVRAHVCVCVSVQREYQEISPPKETNRQRNKGTREQHHDTIPRDSTNRHSRQEHPEQREGGETTNHNMNAPQQHPSTQTCSGGGKHTKRKRGARQPHTKTEETRHTQMRTYCAGAAAQHNHRKSHCSPPQRNAATHSPQPNLSHGNESPADCVCLCLQLCVCDYQYVLWCQAREEMFTMESYLLTHTHTHPLPWRRMTRKGVALFMKEEEACRDPC